MTLCPARLTRRQHVSSSTALAALAAGPGLAACGLGGAPAAPSAKVPPAQLHFTFYGSMLKDKQWADFARGFEAEHPGVTVNVERATGANLQKLLTLMTAGTPPDVFSISSTDFPTLVNAGGVRALDDLIKRDRYDIQDFWPAAVQQFTYKGKLWSLDENIQTFPLWFNQALFTAAGVGLPDETWTMETLLDRTRRLTRREGGPNDVIGFAFFRGIQQATYQYVLANGGKLFDADEDPKRGRFSEAVVVDTLQGLGDLITRHQVVASADEIRTMDEANRFFTGKLAIHQRNVATNVMADAIKGAFKFGAAPQPKGKAGSGATVLPHGNSLSAPGKNLEAAWAFLKALAGPVGHKAGTDTEGTLAGRKSVVERHWQQGAEWASTRKAVTSMLQIAKPMPNSPYIGDAITVINRELNTLWSGAAPARQVATTIDGLLTGVFQGGGG